MYTAQASAATRFKVGLFTLSGLLLTFLILSRVNDNPYWWRRCQMVQINIADATGLKTKSPIRSLGIEIGYLQTILLTETHVKLGICLTEPVEVLKNTRAYLKSDGFLGDKFVELKPVKYLGLKSFLKQLWHQEWIASTWAAHEPTTPIIIGVDESKEEKQPLLHSKLKEIPVGDDPQDIQHLVLRVDSLVEHMTHLTQHLKKSINPEDIQKIMRELNHTLANAAKTISPSGGLNQTAQRALGKLEEAIEQLRDLSTRVNQGKGSLGMLLNDPIYAEELHQAIRNINRLLTRVHDIQFMVDLGAMNVTQYPTGGGRAWFQLGIWPRTNRYYLLGASSDPRGKISNSSVTTTAGGITNITQTQSNDQTGVLLTLMMGKVYWNRMDVSLGLLYGDGTVSFNALLGPTNFENRIQLRNDLYIRNAIGTLDDRVSLTVYPVPHLYVRAGLESFRGDPIHRRVILFYGAGISFNDEDIKLLFTLK